MLSIQPYGPPQAGEFVDHVHHARILNERKLPRVSVQAGYAGRIAILLDWIVDSIKGCVGAERRPRGLIFLHCPGRHRKFVWLEPSRIGWVPARGAAYERPRARKIRDGGHARGLVF